MELATIDKEILLEPGDIVEVRYALTGTNEVTEGLVIHQLKQSLATDVRFNYQGSKIEEGYDIDQVPYRHLLIYVQVRKKARDSRGPIEYASMSNFEAYMRAVPIVWAEKVQYVKATLSKAAAVVGAIAEELPAATRNTSIALLALAGIVAWAWFFGLPKRAK